MFMVANRHAKHPFEPQRVVILNQASATESGCWEALWEALPDLKEWAMFKTPENGAQDVVVHGGYLDSNPRMSYDAG